MKYFYTSNDYLSKNVCKCKFWYDIFVSITVVNLKESTQLWGALNKSCFKGQSYCSFNVKDGVQPVKCTLFFYLLFFQRKLTAARQPKFEHYACRVANLSAQTYSLIKAASKLNPTLNLAAPI